MERNKTYHRRKICVIGLVVAACVCVLLGRLVYLMIFRGDYYSRLATDLQQRERQIKAARGKILDAGGVVLAGNKSVCTISVIHNQIEDPEGVIAMLVKELDLPEDRVRKRVEKYSSIEKIKSNVDKETGNRILAYGYAGVKVDEDYKREYPYDDLASKVLGFTGGDNQGIIGLETVYDDYLQGQDGTILTTTDARGVEVDNIGEERIEPVAGNNLRLSLDANIQLFAAQAAEKAYLQKDADSVSILVMNPKDGQMFAMVDYPEFNLNQPFELTEEYREYAGTDEEQDYLNQMWRNHCINDTYEPGSTFKIITSAAALEEGVVSLEDRFHCPGYIIVEDRRIRCHKTTGHGAESFVEGIENSCNPVFINVGLRIGADRFYDYFDQFGLLTKTGIDLPGEAATIMHKRENIGLVELATISFGQSFQITPIQLAATVSSIINGGNRVTPHFGVQVEDAFGNCIEKFSYEQKEGICSSETSEKMRYLLEKVVSEGGGNKAYIEGYSIGGKTATSQTLPRSANRYISSFLGFAPADDPQVLVLVIIRNPSGIYYGGTIAAPVAKEIFENILPYLELQ
ncbi:MAG: penicillin-binding transpeptidase domain-containing protein [Agathobacter sp.]|nr:penicillin-binding transpeptidase domain-containing protein [Agathobacter sp.]